MGGGGKKSSLSFNDLEAVRKKSSLTKITRQERKVDSNIASNNTGGRKLRVRELLVTWVGVVCESQWGGKSRP